MSYISGSVAGGLEAWEEEYGRHINASLATLTRKRRLQILLSAGLVTGIEISNRLSINVLLPDMQGNVAANADEISWVVILYNLGFLCSMAISYWVARVLGTRRHLLSSIALYAVGAIGCVYSSRDLKLLLISRVIMGFGGGTFLARTVFLAGLMFPGKDRVYAVTWLYGELGFFMLIYPVTMGWISDSFHWNYAFLLDFPFLALGAFLIRKFVPWGYLSLRSEKSYVDLWGAGLLIAGLASLQIALSRGERDQWLQSPFIVSTLVLGLLCLVTFVWWDWRPENPAPVLHLRTIWRHLPLRSSLGLIMIVGALLGAGLFVIPQYVRHVQDYSATQTGGFVSAYTGGLCCGLLFFLRLALPRLGGVKTAALGTVMILGACANFVYIWTPTTPTALLAFSTFMQGFALAPMLMGAANIATSHATQTQLNDVSTSYFFVRQLGNTFGVTAVTIMFDHRMTLHSARLLDVANRLDPTAQSTLSQYAGIIARNGGAASNPALGAVQVLQANVVTQSELLSYIDIYWALAVLAAIALAMLVFTSIRTAIEVDPHFHLW